MMIRLTLSCVLLVVLIACSSPEQSILAPPLAQSAVGNSAPAVTVTSLPAEVRDTYTQYETRTYEVTAPSDGTLVSRLAWDPQKTGAKLKLTLGDMSFYATAPDWSPVIGRVKALAGQTYRVEVQEGFALWDYSFNQDPFVLTISVER